MKNTKVFITDISRRGGYAAVAFKGCPLRCKWCITPEARQFGQEIAFDIDSCVTCAACNRACGVGMQKMRPSRIYDRSFCTVCGNCVPACPNGLLKLIRREETAGGIAEAAAKAGLPLLLTGGEPTAQPEAFRAVLECAAELGVKADLHTCGDYAPELNADIVSRVRRVYFDIKELDARSFAADTRGDLGRVLANLRALDGAGKDTVIRCTLIPGVNLNAEFFASLAELLRSLENVSRTELAPYSDECIKKARLVDIFHMPRYRVPARAELETAAETLRKLGTENVRVLAE